MSTNIAIFLFDGAEELDWAGPWEVLRAWQILRPQDGARVFSLARAGGVITSAKGLRALPDYTWATAPGQVDVLVYPGGDGRRAHMDDPMIHDWVRDLQDRGALMTSVCTGSLVYAAAGLLDGVTATTHWSAVDELRGYGVTVDPDARFIDAGPIITSAGVSAGIDMSLHLIARLVSVNAAREVKRYIQYDPAPPV